MRQRYRIIGENARIIREGIEALAVVNARLAAAAQNAQNSQTTTQQRATVPLPE